MICTYAYSFHYAFVLLLRIKVKESKDSLKSNLVNVQFNTTNARYILLKSKDQMKIPLMIL